MYFYQVRELVLLKLLKCYTAFSLKLTNMGYRIKQLANRNIETALSLCSVKAVSTYRRGFHLHWIAELKANRARVVVVQRIQGELRAVGPFS